jgi:hypothetical protein
MKWIAFLIVFSCTAQSLRQPAYVAQLQRPAAAAAGTEWVTGVTAFGTPSNVFDLEIGCRIQIGASDVVVTHLGRWVKSGNSQTHVIRIQGIDCNTLASATVDCNGAAAGAFVYAALASSFTMTNGAYYHILSAESNGGDDWYYATTTVSTTGVEAALNRAYASLGGAAGCTAEDANQIFGPVSFKYSSP